MCNSINHICNVYNIKKKQLNKSNVHKIYYESCDQDRQRGGIIFDLFFDLLFLRDEMPWDGDLRELIDYLCTY